MIKYLIVFFVSMVPLIELRGAIPVGAALDIPWYANMLAAIIGNVVPVPFILLFIRKFIAWMENTGHFRWFVNILNKKIRKHTKKILKYANYGLLVFVAIPLPGTGAWTGALVAAVLDMRIRKAFLSIFFGVLIASVIMAAASYGVVGFLQYLL